MNHFALRKLSLTCLAFGCFMLLLDSAGQSLIAGTPSDAATPRSTAQDAASTFENGSTRSSDIGEPVISGAVSRQVEEFKRAVDDWILENLPELPSDRETFLSLPSAVQPRVYLRLTNEVRAELWRAKFDQVLQARSWSDAELELLIELYDYASADFLGMTEGDEDEREASLAIIADWSDRASRIMDAKIIPQITSTLDDLSTVEKDLNGPMRNEWPTEWLREQDEDSAFNPFDNYLVNYCDCFSIGPGGGTCGLEAHCGTAECTERRCGRFLLYTCKGRCVSITPHTVRQPDEPSPIDKAGLP